MSSDEQKPYLKHFNYSEFDSPDEPGSGKNMQDSTVEMLDNARDMAGVPFKINSGFRTESHNKEVGGVPESAHTRGYAADINLEGFSDNDVLRVICSCIIAGFRRIGYSGGSFVHVDNDPDKPHNSSGLITWDYSNE